MRLKFISMMGVCLCLLVGCSQGTMAKKDGKDDNMAPSFTLQDIEGNTHKLKDYEGKKLYIKLWASWCPICLSGLEELNSLDLETLGYEVLTIVAPEYRNEKNKEDFSSWYSSLSYKNIKVLFDVNGTYMQEIGVRGYPTSVFIDSKGDLIKVQPGHLNIEQIDEIMQTMK